MNASGKGQRRAVRDGFGISLALPLPPTHNEPVKKTGPFAERLFVSVRHGYPALYFLTVT
jgi:hypothetical protein